MPFGGPKGNAKWYEILFGAFINNLQDTNWSTMSVLECHSLCPYPAAQLSSFLVGPHYFCWKVENWSYISCQKYDDYI